ncbi:VOC family protein [Pseudoxanthobacter sp.]|uniref:VOC family protein n=1 Tax=Pseudoxanthobacter sp. TaxID=1925742 RepID=UPI002FE3A2B6
MTTKHGHFVWNELYTRDPQAAVRFYSETLGWTFDPMPMENGTTYYVARDGADYVAGIFQMAGPEFDGIPEHWFAYIEADDVDNRTAMVAAAGGRIIRAPWDIPQVGRIAIVQAPTGAFYGLMTSLAA